MKVLYANRIIKDKLNNVQPAFTIDNVPGTWYQSTLDELANRGYDGYGNPL